MQLGVQVKKRIVRKKILKSNRLEVENLYMYTGDNIPSTFFLITMHYCNSESNKNGSSDHQWARTLLNKGAIGDRVAAATILIQVWY